MASMTWWWLVTGCVLTTSSETGSSLQPPQLFPLNVPSGRGLGDPMDIVCSLKKGGLPVTFSWRHNGQEVESRQNVKVVTFDKRSLYVVNSISPEDVGNYTCVASNLAGSDTAVAELFVEVPPHWAKEPADTNAAKGARVTVDCSATGHPAPRISWSRQKEDLREPVPIRNEPQRSVAANGTLVFTHVDEADAGVYVCEAHNGIGNGLRKSIKLSVHAPPQLKDMFQAVTVRRGHTARLLCEVTGDQPLVVNWRKENDDIIIQFGTRFEVVRDTTDNGVKSELLIHDSQQSDVGLYTCHVQNQFGEDEGKLKVVVLEPPAPPTVVRATEVTSRSARLTWQPAAVGDGVVESYVVRYWRNDEKRGKLHQVTLPAVQTSVLLNNLHPGTSYTIQVLAQNNVGLGDPSQPLPFRTVEEAPEGAPLDVRVEPVSSKAVRVTWKPPQRHHWNGVLRGYYVGHKTARSSSQYTYQTVETADRRGGSLLLQGLQKSSSYSIVVKAFNSIGSGPPSHEVEVDTLEEDPPPPPVVGVSDVTSSSVGIHWNIGVEKPSAIVQYLLEFREDGDEWEHVHLPGERNVFFLTGLKGSTRYEIRLAAYNVFGRGEFSPTIDFTTAQPELPVPFAALPSNTPFYFRPYFVIPVAASVVVIVTTVVIAWVCYKRMTLRQDRLLAACQPYDGRLVGARASLQSRDGYCDVNRPPSYTPPMAARHPSVGTEDDAYDAPWDMSAAGPGNGQAGSYTRLKNQMPNQPIPVPVGSHPSGGAR